MSGGHFEYQQFRINDIADEIEQLLSEDSFCDSFVLPPTLEELKNAVTILRIAAIYTNRIDWLICGDDGEYEFHKRLEKELEELDSHSD